MTIDTQKLAESIERVRRLDRVRRNANPTDFESEAPLMADIIRQQGEVIRELREALDWIKGFSHNYVVFPKKGDECIIMKCNEALALSAPLVEKAGEL